MRTSELGLLVTVNERAGAHGSMATRIMAARRRRKERLAGARWSTR